MAPRAELKLHRYSGLVWWGEHEQKSVYKNLPLTTISFDGGGAQRFVQFVHDLREAARAAVAVVVGRVLPPSLRGKTRRIVAEDEQQLEAMREQQVAVSNLTASEVPTALVDLDNLTINQAIFGVQGFDDVAHLDMPSLVEAGRRFGEAMVDLLVQTKHHPNHAGGMHSHDKTARSAAKTGRGSVEPAAEEEEGTEDTMYRRLGEASCQPTTAAGIRVCVHNRVGRVEVTSDDALDRWLVLRVGGPHPQISLFERTAPRSWRANFKLCRAGRYTIHVRAMMAQQPWLEWSANWTAHPTRPPCAGPWYAGAILPQHIIEHDGAASTTSCAGGLWSWPDSNEYRSAAGTMLEQITPAPHPNRTSLQTLFGSLRFTEPSPRRANAALTPPPIQPPANAASSLIICVVGDSQMRTLADGIVQHLVEAARAAAARRAEEPLAACPKNPTGAQTCKRIVCAGSTQNVSVHYFRASYGNELATQLPFTGRPTLTEHLGRQCSVALFNSGQWWASWKKKPKPPHTALAPGEYATHVEALMAQLKTIRVPVAWVATNPYPINAGGPDYTWSRARPYDMSACPPGERRFLHVLHAYNRHAKRLAACMG